MSVEISHIIFLLLFVCGTNSLVEVLSPQEIAGVYPDAPLHMNPKTFDITAELVLPVEDLCQEEIPPSVNLTNRLVLVWNWEVCSTETFAKKILRHDPTALGHLEKAEFENDMSLEFPSINVNDYYKLHDYLQRSDRQPVIVHIRNTDYNPWLSLGDGPAGQFTQVFFELFAFVCLMLSFAKLYVFVKFQSFRANVTQTCLWMEALTAIMRIFYMVGPLDFGIPYMTWSASTWFVDTPNILSLLSTLLITFYWQEIITAMGDRLSNKLINNLSKFRVPFLIIAVIIIILHIVVTVNSFMYFMTDNANTVSAIIALIVSFGISVFFFIIGYRIFTVTDKRNAAVGERKATRVSKFILFSACFMMLRILGLILYISASGAGRGAYFGIWWLIFFASWSLSFAKIMAFEPPPDASKSFGSYFRRPNRFIRLMLNKYLGWSITVDSEKSGGDLQMSSNTEKSGNLGVSSKSGYDEEESEQNSV